MAGSSVASPSSSSSSSLSLVDSLFQRSLDDIIKAIRSNPAGETAIISRSLDEIRREIRSADPDTKAVALRKLTYLYSIHGADMSYASFHVLELLPSLSPSHKRAAYLAASLSFSPSTDVLLLATNQLRKDLSPSAPSPIVSLALEFLSVAATHDLARDLAPEVHALLSHPKPVIRSKAAAAARRIFAVYPDAVRVSFKRLVDALDSSSADPRALSAAVGVFCELSASDDPRSYLPLAPEFYKILVDSRDNWVLIKVLKIFSRLAPLEHRLARRLVDPVCDHMRRSNARSLVFECVRTTAVGLGDFKPAVRLAADKAKEFLEVENDSNLRFMGLKALSLLGQPHSWVVAESMEAVVKSLSDPDPNMHREALRLIMGMINENNAIDISSMLVGHALKVDPEFCNEILDAVLESCGNNFYEMVVDFDRYVSLLGKMARNPHCTRSEEIERQLVDISMRVKDVRPQLVHVVRELLIDPALLGIPDLYKVLSAAAWLSGEYVELSRNPLELVEALLQPRTNLLPGSVRAVYLQAVWKIVSFVFSLSMEEPACIPADREAGGNISIESGDEGKQPLYLESLKEMLNLIESAMGPLIQSDEIEVHERAMNVSGFVQMLQDILVPNAENTVDEDGIRMAELVGNFISAFSEKLGPIPANAQAKVPVPAGLILNENLTDLSIILTDEGIGSSLSPLPFSLRSCQQDETREEPHHTTESSSLAEHRKRHELYYLSSSKEGNESNDYPRANDVQPSVDQADATNDLVNLMDPSSSKAKKIKSTKPRPVVVKLDEEDAASIPSATIGRELKEDPISSAVFDILSGSNDLVPSLHPKFSDESQRKPEFMEKKVPEQRRQTSSRNRSRHHSSGKEKLESSSGTKERREGGKSSSSRSSKIHGKDEHRDQEELSSRLVLPQSSVVQDFLL